MAVGDTDCRGQEWELGDEGGGGCTSSTGHDGEDVALVRNGAILEFPVWGTKKEDAPSWGDSVTGSSL